MSARNWLSASLNHAQRGLDADRDPPNLRRYPSIPAADEPAPRMSDEELRARLRHEFRDEPRRESWEDMAADDAGVRRWGEL